MFSLFGLLKQNLLRLCNFSTPEQFGASKKRERSFFGFWKRMQRAPGNLVRRIKGVKERGWQKLKDDVKQGIKVKKERNCQEGYNQYDEIHRQIRHRALPSGFKKFEWYYFGVFFARLVIFSGGYALMHVWRNSIADLGVYTWILFAIQAFQIAAILSMIPGMYGHYHRSLMSGISGIQARAFWLSLLTLLARTIVPTPESKDFNTWAIVFTAILLALDVAAIVLSGAFAFWANQFYRQRGRVLHEIVSKEENARKFTATGTWVQTWRGWLNTLWPYTLPVWAIFLLAAAFEMLIFDVTSFWFTLTALLTLPWGISWQWVYLIAGEEGVTDPHQAETGIVYSKDESAYPYVRNYAFAYVIVSACWITALANFGIQIYFLTLLEANNFVVGFLYGLAVAIAASFAFLQFILNLGIFAMLYFLEQRLKDEYCVKTTLTYVTSQFYRSNYIEQVMDEAELYKDKSEKETVYSPIPERDPSETPTLLSVKRID